MFLEPHAGTGVFFLPLPTRTQNSRFRREPRTRDEQPVGTSSFQFPNRVNRSSVSVGHITISRFWANFFFFIFYARVSRFEIIFLEIQIEIVVDFTILTPGRTVHV